MSTSLWAAQARGALKRIDSKLVGALEFGSGAAAMRI
jgi:hypothetical protein